ncbi:hypothetical protein GTY65_29005 [Streptomyces sp. SID8379]|uniref:hypothetical protein n=1 Tax=unclassified Streptomyces TaxID=2593676 RepID=UPI00036AC1A1|nr:MULTISPECIES: hypothetical protein [unclassified Streptomyces]MYW68082.1 hypothetical protein [Streptomyces sp. SID8379]
MNISEPRAARRRGIGGALAAVALACGLIAAAAPAQAATGTPVAVSSYTYSSEAGDFVGQGQSASYKAPATPVRISGTAQDATVTVTLPDDSEWTVQLAAPKGEELHPGVYRGAERAPFRTGRAPGLDVSGEYRGCNTIWGQFTVNQIETDSTGAVTRLDASFTQRCDSATAPALKGTVKFAAYPLSYAYTSDADDWIGQGGSGTFTGATSLFSLSGTVTSGFDYTVEGKREEWSVTFYVPEGDRLEAGRTYTVDPEKGGLVAMGNGRACGFAGGTLTVDRLATTADGTIKALAARFSQYCQGATARYNGTIHYHA